ncbi:Ribosomal protein L13 [Spironucleus salmonicida]|uniref:Ribosomal protein L13 n=1 Tax=Spironucleus salmonicida TaxID=348837 RepID=V6LAZ2_9EUKA|nr:Ribosomal protein L13 [Spironucleus salmonicida]|eukprot:EST41625.1 Ribosomal protein L13 [Spironucleus salmonicida]
MAGHNLAFSTQKRQKCQRKGPSLVKTWFNQPFRAQARRAARVLKAKHAFPRPTSTLRPVVTSCSIKHNLKQREGRGFSIAELKAVGMTPIRARQVGISVDARRINKSEISLKRNVDRLNAYNSKIVIFKKDASAEEIKAATQVCKPMTFKMSAPVIATAKVADFPKMECYAAMQELRNLRSKHRFSNEKARRDSKSKK